MNKASVRRHILAKHGKQQLAKLDIDTLPDHYNKLQALNQLLNEKFGHRKVTRHG